MRLKVRRVYGRRAEGRLLVSSEPISFLGGVEPESGRVVERSHPLHGQSIAGVLLVLPHTKGSSVGCYVMYSLARHGTAPAGIVAELADEMLVSGAVISEIPLGVCEGAAGRLSELSGRRAVLELTRGYLEVRR